MSQHKSDNNKRRITLTYGFCVLFRDNGTINVLLLYAAESISRGVVTQLFAPSLLIFTLLCFKICNYVTSFIRLSWFCLSFCFISQSYIKENHSNWKKVSSFLLLFSSLTTKMMISFIRIKLTRKLLFRIIFLILLLLPQFHSLVHSRDLKKRCAFFYQFAIAFLTSSQSQF